MITQLWSTPFLQTKMPDDIRDRFVNYLLTKYDLINPPSDFGQLNILEDDAQVVQEFKEQVIYPAFNEFLESTLGKDTGDWTSNRVHGWITGSGRDYSINFHNHRGAQLSAVFYLMCDDLPGGKITFTDPRMNANRGYDESFLPWFKHLEFNPKSGDVVIFPSFLYHFVSTYQGNIRLALPVDLFLRTNK
jgi:hypothetical protein